MLFTPLSTRIRPKDLLTARQASHLSLEPSLSKFSLDISPNQSRVSLNTLMFSTAICKSYDTFIKTSRQRALYLPKPIHFSSRELHQQKMISRLFEVVKNGEVDSVQDLFMQIEKEESVLEDNTGRTLLSMAAEGGYPDIVKTIIAVDDTAINEKDHNGMTPLHYASKHGHLEVSQELIARGAPINEKDHQGLTPLHYAAGSGYRKTVQELIARGASINEKDNQGHTPMHYAAEHGHRKVIQELMAPDISTLSDAAKYGRLDIVRKLIAEGASIHLKDKKRSSPLQNAVKYGHLAVVQELIARGASVDEKDNKGFTPLHHAVKYGHLAVVQELLDRGASSNSKEIRGFVPLHYAAIYGHLAVVQKLLDRGASINQKTQFDASPLHYASRHGHTEVVRELLARGALINDKNDIGSMPLHYAAEYGHPKVVRELLAQGALINDKDNKGLTAIQYAGQYGQLKVIQELLAQGASINDKDNNDLTILHQAARHGYLKTVPTLIDHGAIIDEKDARGLTPLHYAAEHGQLKTVQILIDRGALLNEKDIWGRSPLHLAVLQGHLDVVQELIDRGASIHEMDSNNLTPFHYAIRQADLGMIRHWLQKGFIVAGFQDNRGRTLLHEAATSGEPLTVMLLAQKLGDDLQIKDDDGKTPLDLATRQLEILQDSLKNMDTKHKSTALKEQIKKYKEIIQFLSEKSSSANGSTTEMEPQIHKAIAQMLGIYRRDGIKGVANNLKENYKNWNHLEVKKLFALRVQAKAAEPDPDFQKGSDRTLRNKVISQLSKMIEKTPPASPEAYWWRSIVNLAFDRPLEALLFPGFGLDGLIGMEPVKTALKTHTVNVMRAGKKKPANLCFIGPSGTGKNFTVKQLAQEVGWNVFELKLSDIQGPLVGDSGKKIQQLEQTLQAKARQRPLFLFLDEAEKYMPRRDEAVDGHARVQTGELLTFLERISRHPDIIVIAATNCSNDMDMAFWRRCSEVIEIGLPDLADRKQLWKGFLEKIFGDSQEWFGNLNSAELTEKLMGQIAENTEGMSRGDIENVVNQIENLTEEKQREEIRNREILAMKLMDQDHESGLRLYLHSRNAPLEIPVSSIADCIDHFKQIQKKIRQGHLNSQQTAQKFQQEEEPQFPQKISVFNTHLPSDDQKWELPIERLTLQVKNLNSQGTQKQKAFSSLSVSEKENGKLPIDLGKMKLEEVLSLSEKLKPDTKSPAKSGKDNNRLKAIGAAFLVGTTVIGTLTTALFAPQVLTFLSGIMDIQNIGAAFSVLSLLSPLMSQLKNNDKFMPETKGRLLEMIQNFKDQLPTIKRPFFLWRYEDREEYDQKETLISGLNEAANIFEAEVNRTPIGADSSSVLLATEKFQKNLNQSCQNYLLSIENKLTEENKNKLQKWLALTQQLTKLELPLKQEQQLQPNRLSVAIRN